MTLKRVACLGKKSELGVIQRKNIKIDQRALEVKISCVEGRYKTSVQNFDLQKIISKGLFDQDYGVCRPILRVSYKRDYFKIYNVRLTIDRYIKFVKLNSRGKVLIKCISLIFFN